MTYRAVLFDLDGTLLNTIDDLADAMNAALAELGFPTHSVDRCKQFVGDGLRTYAVRALPQQQPDEQAIERCCDVFRREYGQRWQVKTRAYEGIAELLDGLTRRGLTMSVLSNKPDDFTKLMVARMLDRWRFEVIRGVGADGVKKPDPAGALAIAAHHGVAPAEFLYVGDTNTDMQTARGAGMYAVGVTWGFRPAEELTESGAARLIDRPEELLGLL